MPLPLSAGCIRVCIQTTEIALLKERVNLVQEQMDRIEAKLDRLNNWLLGFAFSALLALVVALVRKV